MWILDERQHMRFLRPIYGMTLRDKIRRGDIPVQLEENII
jgi:hypothetical protein